MVAQPLTLLAVGDVFLNRADPGAAFAKVLAILNRTLPLQRRKFLDFLAF